MDKKDNFVELLTNKEFLMCKVINFILPLQKNQAVVLKAIGFVTVQFNLEWLLHYF